MASLNVIGTVVEVILVVSATFASPYQSKEASSTISPDELASIIPICHRDQDFSQCLLKATETLKQRLVEGIPEIGLKSLEPMKVPTVKLQQETQKLSYKAVLMDVELHGLTDYEFKDIKTDMKNHTVTLTAKFNHVYIDTEYMLIGKFEMLPIEGSGRFMANFTDNIAEIKMTGAPIKKKDKEFFMIKDTEVMVYVGGALSDFENLYTGGDMKSQITDHIVQMHSAEIVKELKPAVETVLSMLVEDVAGKFFKSLPYDQLFPK